MRPSGSRPLPVRPRATRRWSILAAVPVVVWLWGTPANGQSPSAWTQMGGDAAHLGAGSGPEPPYRRAWHVDAVPGGPTGRQGLSQPIVVGGLAIATGPEEVVAVDTATGDVAWTIPRDPAPSAPPAVGPGGEGGILLYTEGWAGHPPSPDPSATPSTSPSPPSSPEDDDGVVDSRLVGVDLVSREAAWDPVELGDVSRSGIAVDGDTAYVGDRTGTVRAVDTATGELRWTAEIGGPVDTTPAVGEGSVVVTTRATRSSASSMVALDADSGDQRWRAQPVAQAPSAVSISNGAAFVAGLDVPIEAFDLASGTTRWHSSSPAGGPLDGGAALAGDAVFTIEQRGLLSAFVATSGARRWDFAINEIVLRGGPAVAGNVVLVTTGDGALQAFDAATGDRRWRGVEGSGPARGVALDGEVVVVLRAGASAGLDGWVRDAGGELERLESPTRFDTGPALLAFAGAIIPLALLSFVLARIAGPRLGVAIRDDDGDAPEDPLEPGGGSR